MTTTDHTTVPRAAAPVEEQRSSRSEHSDPHEAGERALVEEELLVEDVSIDGMCGVY